MPYKKAAKFSENRARLSCISWRCMKLASRSAIESLSSAKAGSSDSRGEATFRLREVESRREVRLGGRRGVVGLGGVLRPCEVERLVGAGVVDDMATPAGLPFDTRPTSTTVRRAFWFDEAYNVYRGLSATFRNDLSDEDPPRDDIRLHLL